MPGSLSVAVGVALSLSLSQLIDMPDHQRHRWTGWLSFSAAVALMHFISSLGSLLVWLSTCCSDTWQRGDGLNTLACFSLGCGFYNIYIIYEITGKGCIVVLLQEKMFSIWGILTSSYCCSYSSPRGCSSKSMWKSGRQVLLCHL